MLAQDIRRELLLRLKRTIDRYPIDATEVRQQKDGKMMVYKLRDMTAAYKDLTEDMPKAQAADIEDLSPLVQLLGGPGHE